MGAIISLVGRPGPILKSHGSIQGSTDGTRQPNAGPRMARGLRGAGGERQLLAGGGSARHRAASVLAATSDRSRSGSAVDLIDRGAHPVELTGGGRRFLPLARDVLASLEAARIKARLAQGEAAASLRVRGHARAFDHVLPALAGRARNAPAARSRSQTLSDHSRACEDLMYQRRVQFVLCYGHPDVPGRLDEGRLSRGQAWRRRPATGLGAGRFGATAVRARAQCPAAGPRLQRRLGLGPHPARAVCRSASQNAGRRGAGTCRSCSARTTRSC